MYVREFVGVSIVIAAKLPLSLGPSKPRRSVETSSRVPVTNYAYTYGTVSRVPVIRRMAEIVLTFGQSA